MSNFKTRLSARPKLFNLNQGHPSEKFFFWSNPYEIEVMITSLIEMLELPNFGHMTPSTVYRPTHNIVTYGELIPLRNDTDWCWSVTGIS